MAKLLLTALLFSFSLLGSSGQDLDDFTDELNSAVQNVTSGLDEIIYWNTTLSLPLVIPGISDVIINLTDLVITGITDLHVTRGTHNPEDDEVVMSMELPGALITTDHLTMQGTIMSNIDIDGAGPASFDIRNFTMVVTGRVFSFDDSNGGVPSMRFTLLSNTLELILYRWTINMEGLTPDSDLGLLINQFLSSLGPDIFRALTNYLNSVPGFSLALGRKLNLIFNHPIDFSDHRWVADELQMQDNVDAVLRQLTFDKVLKAIGDLEE